MSAGRVICAVLVLLLLAPLPAAAGGSWMNTPDERVEPGEEVELVSYVGATNADHGPWGAFLDLGPMDQQGNFSGQLMPLGPVTITLTGLNGYLSHRVYLRFTLPADPVPGIYQVSVTNPNGDFLGDLIGAHLAVGLEAVPPTYEWPIDEPLVQQLPDDAVLAGPGWVLTVGEIRNGAVPTSTTETPQLTSPTGLATTPIQSPTTLPAVQLSEDMRPLLTPFLIVIGITAALLASAIVSHVIGPKTQGHETTEYERHEVVEPVRSRR